MPRKQFQNNWLYDVFHENSKNHTLARDFQTDETSFPARPDGKRYEDVPIVELPGTIDDTVGETIENRRSPDAFESMQVSIASLGALLQTAAGATAEDEHGTRRAHPSAGRRYPIEVYVAAIDTELPAAVYHYQANDGTLERIREDARPEAWSFTEDGSVGDAAVVLFVTARLERTTEKYGERGYRYALLEAGHLMQNVCLVAERLGLACRPYGGFVEDELDAFLALGDDETSLYAGLVGVPATD